MRSAAWPLVYLSVLKLRIVVLLLVVAVVAALVAGAGDFQFGRITLLALVGGMACAGASALNNYLDRDIDSIMPRTRKRALAEKKANPSKVLALGLGLTVISLIVALKLGYLVSLSLGLGTVIYVVLYTMWLKRRTPLNIVFGGLSGSCTVLAGWFATTSELSLTPFLIAGIVFIWTPSHFWSFALVHQDSYQKAKIPMLPLVLGVKSTAGYIVLHSALLVLVSAGVYFIGSLGQVYLIGSLALGTLFLASSLWLWRYPNRQWAWRNYKLSGIYLLGIFLLMAIDVLA
ncbi:MAG: protoheme IX farnesyltransferase [Chloroflexi bacterium]|nr:protoheme IX farnesyltransferase [Chloroflexota bacterium]